jgi:hypothetical protein
MKRIILAVFLLLFALDAHAMIIIGGTGATSDPPAATCETQSTDVDITSYAGTATNYGDQDRGQSWKSGVSKPLYSFTFRRFSDDGGATAIKLRMGESANLSSTYLVEYTCTIPDAVGDVECVVPSGSRPELTSGNTYYVGFVNTGGSTWNVGRSAASTSSYADGQAFYDATADYNLTGTTYDLRMKVKVCD